MEKNENFREVVTLIEKSDILNRSVTLGQLIEVSKQVEITMKPIEQGEWSVLIYKCFVLASGLPTEQREIISGL